MGLNTEISWCDSTWSPVVGCQPISEGCKNCWAAKMATRQSARGRPFQGTAQRGKWTGEVFVAEGRMNWPAKWRKPRRIAVCLMGDLFYKEVPDSVIDQVFDVMIGNRQHTYLLLTKRPERMTIFINRYVRRSGLTKETLRHIWCGFSAENQATADWRIGQLWDINYLITFVSLEPLVGPVSLRKWIGIKGRKYLDWLIVGGESGHHARPLHPAWAQNLRDQCLEAKIPLFFKQWGQWFPVSQARALPPWRDFKEEDHRVFIGHKVYLKNFVDQSGFFCSPPVAEQSSGEAVVRLGKKSSGCMLDGEHYLQFPESEFFLR